ncbi:hypothetical protein GGQ05_001770 [Salinibacter ruber]|uniref:Uncharacterized protein n=1 Tax=Salinibacter ruber TaxID=146919 RepID=A0A9X2Q721_9BACT|nr:hypothetical protein [Salinibacter ruber]MCS3709868.1 hypothetical protein [Salinibacter ruber]MCS4170304.1 hypothetical protein [Salinibacter ruber]
MHQARPASTRRPSVGCSQRFLYLCAVRLSLRERILPPFSLHTTYRVPTSGQPPLDPWTRTPELCQLSPLNQRLLFILDPVSDPPEDDPV